MKPPKQPECKTPETFPAVITNRRGLDRIRYRAGDYAGVRQWLFERLDQEPKLRAWTYRGADDPGIALYEGAALLLDSLTVYQEAYANEAFLRTATWRESVTELVRLLGYHLKPGIGGAGTFAFEVDGTTPVTIPIGLAVRATLEPAPQQAEFQTAEETVALPWLSQLALMRPQLPRQILPGTTKLVVAAGTPLTFAKGDRIALGVSNGAALSPFEIVVVESVAQWHGRSVLTLRGTITKITTKLVTLTAVKLDRTFHLTGHTAPPTYVTVDSSGNPHYHNTPFTLTLGTRTLSLDPQANDLALGTRLAIQLSTTNTFSTVADAQLALARVVPDFAAITDALVGASQLALAMVTDVRPTTVVYGPMSVPSTVVTLAAALGAGTEVADIRNVLVNTVAGAPFTVGSVWENLDLAPTWLFYWGDPAKAKDLKGRRIGIAPGGRPSYEVNVVDVIATGISDLSVIVLDRHVDYADFGEGNKTAVFGNLADVTQGKSEQEAVLGNGDDRASFQSFQIPKGPLTYLERAALTPPHRPEIEIIVGGRRWTYVSVLYGSAPDAEVYIVRQDDDGRSWVQFGDGKTGARLPSGRDNVVVRWRTGAGAYGALAEGTTPSADRFAHLGDVELVGIVSGGSAPEDPTTARRAAPGRVQSLGRIVSITDVEAEALSIGGVAQARAAWTIANGLPCVQVTLLMQAGRTAELDSARQVLATANRLRGPQRFPIVVVPGAFEYVYLDVSVAIDPSYDPQPVRDAVRAAIVTGLFGERSPRTFGDAEYATRIEGVAQNVPGVSWALVNSFGSLGVADDPTTLVYPTAPSRAATVPCPTTHVLRLAPAHLIVRAVAGAS